MNAKRRFGNPASAESDCLRKKGRLVGCGGRRFDQRWPGVRRFPRRIDHEDLKMVQVMKMVTEWRPDGGNARRGWMSCFLPKQGIVGEMMDIGMLCVNQLASVSNLWR
jgi:hypothetical protein